MNVYKHLLNKQSCVGVFISTLSKHVKPGSNSNYNSYRLASFGM